MMDWMDWMDWNCSTGGGGLLVGVVVGQVVATEIWMLLSGPVI